MDAIKLGIEQIKTLHQACVDGGQNPPFSLDDFLKDLEAEKLKWAEFPEGHLIVNISRLLSQYHKVLHEILYIPPRR